MLTLKPISFNIHDTFVIHDTFSHLKTAISFNIFVGTSDILSVWKDRYVGAHRKPKFPPTNMPFLWDYFFFFFVILKNNSTYDIIIRLYVSYLWNVHIYWKRERGH